VGHYEVPQCEKLCPVDCIFQDENFVETKASLKQKYLKLTADE
jgi:formate hydrogenlyase subunit 6/NADH:ubiquinone oxidoreductase subunit I